MKKHSLLLLLIFLFPFCMAQKLPEGYILQYQQTFGDIRSLTDFSVANPELWGIYKTGANYYLQFTASEDHGIQPALPRNMAILKNHVYGDFILEADVMPLFDTNGFGEICLFLGFRDQSRYYYIQMANRCDSISHGIYLVKNSAVKRLTPLDLQPVIWTRDKWIKIRLERNIVKRTILVFAGNMEQPILQTKDYELVMGSVGFGSFAGAGQIDNIRIWAPTVIGNE
jgi:hypothetical protein